jgi:hypothetical protein
MKKVLIASTALVAATIVSAGAASASEKIKLNLGGYSKWWVVGAWQDSTFQRAGNQQPANVDVKGDNEVFFGGSTTLDNGLKVGIDVQLEAGGHTDSRAAGGTSTTDAIDESYIWVEGGFGKLIVGSKNNGTYLIHNTAPDAAGNWNEGGILSGGFAISQATGVQSMGSIANNASDVAGSGTRTAGTGNTTAILTDGDSEGVTYVSPTFYGFTFGASYKPNGLSEDNRGVEAGGGAAPANLGAMPVYGAGVLYANTFGGVGVKADFGYAQYNPTRAAATAVAAAGSREVHGLQREYSTGANVSYAGFTLGGSYRQIVDNKTGNGIAVNTGVAYLDNSYNGKAWDLGLQYASGPYAVSFAYFNSKTDGLISDPDSDKIEVYQLSGKYNLGAGVDVLASAGYVKSKDERYNSTTAAIADVSENKGWAVMTGLSLAF